MSQTAISHHDLELPEHLEQRLMQLCEDHFNVARKAQGYGDTNIIKTQMPTYRSWAWWRVCAMRSMEKDYSWRTGIADEFRWEKSNRTMGVFERQVTQRRTEMEKNMLRTHRFFSFDKEGDEDGSESEINLIKRRLHFRTAKTGMNIVMKNALARALPCGEAIIEPSMSFGSRPIIRKSKVLLLPDGSPARDSRGLPIPSSEQFQEDDDGGIHLVSDKTKFPPGISLRESNDEHTIIGKRSFNDGAKFTLIDTRDFVCDPRWASLDEANYRGIEIDMTYDDIAAYLSQGWQVDEEALEQYRMDAASIGSSNHSASKTARDSVGEDESDLAHGSHATPKSDETQPFIRLVKEWISVDILGLKFLQNLFVLRDPERGKIICYTLAHNLMAWLPQEARHPLIVVKAEEVAERWYGNGDFKKMFDQFMSIDELKNISRLETLSSGNIKFIKKQLIKNVANGGDLIVRGDVPNELAANVLDPSEAFSVVTITPQIAEVNEQLQFEIGTFRSEWGQINPGSSGGGMEGADTAFGMNLLAEKAATGVESVQDKMAEGFDLAVRAFSRIELLHMDDDDLVNQMGRESASIIKQWVAKNGDDFDDAIETLLANASDSSALAKHQAALQVVQQWRQHPPLAQSTDKPMFRQLLLDLDVKDPDAILLTNEELLAKQPQPGVPGAAVQGAPGVDPMAANAAPAPQAAPPVASAPAGPPRQPPTPPSPGGMPQPA